MLFLCSAKGHVLKGRQGLFQKLTVDLVCRDGLINSDQLKDQVIVGCDRLFTGSCILDGSQNIIRRNIVSALCKIALQNSGILFHIGSDQPFDLAALLCSNRFTVLGICNAVCNKFLQDLTIPYLRSIQNICIQLRDLIFFQFRINRTEIFVRIACLGGSEVRVAFPLCQQEIMHIVGIVFEDTDTFIIIITVIQKIPGRIQGQLLLHIFFRIIGTVALHDRIQHIACIAAAQLSIHHQTHLISIRKIGDFFSLFDQCIVDLLLFL